MPENQKAGGRGRGRKWQQNEKGWIYKRGLACSLNFGHLAAGRGRRAPHTPHAPRAKPQKAAVAAYAGWSGANGRPGATPDVSRGPAPTLLAPAPAGPQSWRSSAGLKTGGLGQAGAGARVSSRPSSNMMLSTAQFNRAVRSYLRGTNGKLYTPEKSEESEPHHCVFLLFLGSGQTETVHVASTGKLASQRPFPASVARV